MFLKKNEKKNETNKWDRFIVLKLLIVSTRQLSFACESLSNTPIRSRVVVRFAVSHHCRRKKRLHSEECLNHFSVSVQQCLVGFPFLERGCHYMASLKKNLSPDVGKLQHIFKFIPFHTAITIQIKHPEHFCNKSVFGQELPGVMSEPWV